MVNICLLNKKKISFCVLKVTSFQFLVKKSFQLLTQQKKTIEEEGNQLLQN